MTPRLIILSLASLALTLHPNAHGVEVAQPAPNCALQALDGAQRYDLHQFRGQVLYLDFWASWCGPCAQSFPFMNRLHHDLAGRGLRIVAVNLDEKPAEAKEFLSKHPAHFALAADGGGNCPQNFGVKGMPSSYLIDRGGIVRHVHLGFRSGESQQLRELVEQLLAEKPKTP